MSTTTESTTPNSKDYLNQIYDAQIETTKEQLTQAYNESASGLDSESEKLKKQRQKDLVQTDVEAQRAQRNYAEVQNAYGLTSGAMAQARLAQDNQRQNDMTDIRTAYLEADADVERRRSLLSQQFESAIKEAQANNDLARAKALYELAREEEAKLLAQQQAGTTNPGSSGTGSSSGRNSGTTEGSGNSGTPEAETQSKPIIDVKEPIAAVGDYVSSVVDNAIAAAGDYISSTGNNAVKGEGSVPPASTSAQSGKSEGNQALTVDMSSIVTLGRGPISETELNRLIAAGEVEEYIVGNTVRFRNVDNSTQAAKGSQSKNAAAGKPSGGAGSGSAAGGLKSQLDRDLLRM